MEHIPGYDNWKTASPYDDDGYGDTWCDCCHEYLSDCTCPENAVEEDE